MASRGEAGSLRSSAAVIVIGVAGIVAGVAALHLAPDGPADAGLGPRFQYNLEALRKTDPALVSHREIGVIETGFEKLTALAVGRADTVLVGGDRAVRQFDASGGGALLELPLDGPPHAVADSGGPLYVCLKDHVETYSLEQVRRLAKWESLGQRAHLVSIALTDEHVFVADAGQRVIWQYDPGGKVIKRIGAKDKERNILGFVTPSPHLDVAIGPDGLLWAANTGLHKLEGYTFRGDLDASWGEPAMGIKGFCGCCNPANFAFLPDGRFVTAEKGLPRVKVYSPDGKFESVVAGPEAFAEPNETLTDDSGAVLDVAVDSKGRILVLDPDTRTVRIFEKTDQSQPPT